MEQKPQTLMEVLQSYETEYQASSVADKDNFARECQFAHQALQKNNYLLDVAKKNPSSLKQAIINIGATGLSLNPVSSYAYLVPRVVNKKPCVCLDISYLGICKAATDSGSVIWVQADIVREKDKFIKRGLGEKPIHETNTFGDRGEIVGAYSVAKLHDGDYLTTTMTIKELNDIRNASEAFKKGFGPWINFYEEMAKKTVIKRAAKLYPKTDRHIVLENAIGVENEVNGIDFDEVKREQIEAKKAIEEDFPRKPEDMEFGDNYLFVWGKFRGKRCHEIDTLEMAKYQDHLEQKTNLDSRYQQGEKYETYKAICFYLDSMLENDSEEETSNDEKVIESEKPTFRLD